MTKPRRKIIIAVLNLFACIILFVCLGLAVIGGPFLIEDAGDGLHFFAFLKQYGSTIAFVLTVLFLMLLYVHQKILFETHKTLEGDGRSFGALDLRVRQIFEFLPVGVIETTREGKIVFCNPMGAYLFGYNSIKDFMTEVNNSPDGMRKVYINPAARDQMVKRLYDQRDAHCKFQESFSRRDGKAVDLVFDLFLRYDPERDEECIFGFIQDVTDRVEFERKLRASEARYRELIAKANSIILCVNTDGRIQYMNDFARNFFGCSMEEVENQHIVGTIIDRGIFDESSVGKILQKICEDCDNTSFGESPIICRDGRKAWICWSSKAIQDSDGKIAEILLIGTDTSALREQELSLKRQLAAEIVLEQISSRFANAGVENSEESIRFALDRMKDFYSAVSAYCCFFNESGFVENFYTSSFGQPDTLKDFIDRFFLSVSTWWFEKLQNSDFIMFSAMDDIPVEIESIKQVGREAGLQRVCVIPIFMQDKFVGFIGLNAVSHEPAWDIKQIDLAKVCGGMFLNLLERKKFLDEISDAKERFDIAVRGAYLGMYDWDIPSGNVVYNDIWFRMLGYSPHEFPHTVETWKKLLHPDDAERVLASLDAYLKGTNTFYSVDFRLKTKDGSWKWILAEGNIKRRAEDGSPLQMIGLQRDISELKSAEIKLRSQKELVESLIENMPAGIFAKDVNDNFRIIIWNRRMEELFGIKRYDVLGKNDFELFDKEMAELYLKDDIEVAQKGLVKQGIHERIQTVRGERWVQTVKVPVLDEDGKVRIIFGILDDITEKEEMELSMRQTQKMQAVGQLAAGVAHEVKNPLAIILLAAEGLAMSKQVIDDEKIQNKVEMIKTASKKANKVIMELLKFSRLADAEMDYIDLHQVIDDAHFLAHNRGKEKYIDFEKEYYAGSLMCLGNPVLLEQVFVNLFNNSIDAIERFGRIIVRTKIKSFSNKRKSIVVEVEDNGPGIPKEILSKIFDPFYTTKDAGHGTGLGLSTVFTILEKHNGHVRVDTERETGARFVITLPFSESHSQSVEKT
jgi:PAS domain S-box-containing protein